MKSFIALLVRNRHLFGTVLALDYKTKPIVILDLSKENKEVKQLDFSNPSIQSTYINALLKRNGAQVAIGRYNEERGIYDHSPLFEGNERRTIHLGNDLFVSANIPVLCPYDGKVHSYQNNAGVGDYGPTIILEHMLEGEIFYTLYGHLTVDSLNNLHIGKEFRKKECMGRVGDSTVNGNWAPHLHFQIIREMQGKRGDFPGVASLQTREEMTNICPDPNMILQINMNTQCPSNATRE